MGRLLSIEIHNFKSYKGTQLIELGDSRFTSIIGPNGAGKSNMMDAISFVLGVRSNRLRAPNMSELIYRGKTGEETELDDAYVSIRYEKSKNKVLQFKRSIVSGVSEYRIDSKVVTVSAYSNALSKENILVKAKNFLVFQGDIESIASQSSKELSRLVEQISGSIDYKEEYDSLKKTLDDAVENSTSSFKRKRGYNAEIKHYMAQQELAGEFHAKSAERDSVHIQIALWKLFHLDKDYKSSEKELDNSTDIISANKQELENMENDYDSVNAEYALARKNISKVTKNVSSKKKELADQKGLLLPIAEKTKSLERSIKKRQARKEVLLVECKRQKAAVEKYSRDLRIVQKALQSFEEEAKEEQLAIAESSRMTEDDHVEYESLKAIFNARTSKEQDILNGLKRQQSILSEKIQSLQGELEQAQLEEERQIRDMSRLKDKIDGLSMSINRDNEMLKEKKQQLNNIITLKQQQEHAAQEYNSRLQETVKSLLDYNASRKDIEKTKKLYEEVETLKRLIPGVRGLLYDLCKPKEKRYETALVTVLGKHFNSIVVDNFSVGEQCISYFKEQRLGVASFIPIDSLSVSPINGALRNTDKKARLAFDIAKFDPQDEKAVQYVCGDCLITDDLTVAKEIRWQRNIKVKCVTLDGSIIHKGNLMTGGKSDTGNTKRWEESNIVSLNSLKEELVSKLQELTRAGHAQVLKEEKLVSEIKALESRLDSSRTSLRAKQLMFQSREDEKGYFASNKAKYLTRLEKLQKDMSKLEEEIGDLEEGMVGIREEIFEEFCEKVGIQNISKYDAITADYFKKTSEKRLQYTTQIKRLETQEAFDKQKYADLKSRVDDLNQSIEQCETNLQDLAREKEMLDSQIEQTTAQLTDIESDLVAAESHVQEKLEAAQKSKEEVLDMQRKIAKLSNQRGDLKERLERFSLMKLNILRDCRLDGLEIPLIEGTMDDIPLTVEDQENDMTDDPVESTGDKVVVDFSKLDKQLKRRSDPEVEEELLEKIRIITAELDKMVVNTRAGEKLQSVTSRYQEAEKEFDERRKAVRQAKDRFHEIQGLRTEAYQEAFEHISTTIDTIYKDLTKSESFPMGGSAYLSLDNEDEPYLGGINYHAMPPMKRFCDMELLSGGEKTIAALALIFAINSYRPSPFFILDEIDAALDGSNVESVTKWIQRTASQGLQFIVISLKSVLFENSDCIVGIYKDQSASKALTLDLRV